MSKLSVILLFFVAIFSFWYMIDFVLNICWMLNTKSTISQILKISTKKYSETQKSVSENCTTFGTNFLSVYRHDWAITAQELKIVKFTFHSLQNIARYLGPKNYNGPFLRGGGGGLHVVNEDRAKIFTGFAIPFNELIF